MFSQGYRYVWLKGSTAINWWLNPQLCWNFFLNLVSYQHKKGLKCKLSFVYMLYTTGKGRSLRQPRAYSASVDTFCTSAQCGQHLGVVGVPITGADVHAVHGDAQVQETFSLTFWTAGRLIKLSWMKLQNLPTN